MCILFKKLSNFLIMTMFFLTFCTVLSCATSSDDEGSNNEPMSVRLSMPEISPTAGDYSEGFKTISIKNPNASGEVFYTTDGTVPSETSSRYVKEFQIIGSKTVKAIVLNDSQKSAVATATFNLNAGKTVSQLGVVMGTVKLSENLSESIREKLADCTVYVLSDDIPGVVKSCKIGETYYFDGLDITKSYKFYFSNKEPGVIPGRKTGRAVTTETSEDSNGEPVVSTVTEVVPAEGGISVDVDLKASGIIRGTAKRFDVTGVEENDHGGTVVYIPGTSYSAYTDSDGSFAISGVPQGQHTVRAQYAGYTFAEKENVLLTSDNGSVPETIIEEEFNLSFGKGIVKGTVVYSDSVSSAENNGITIVLTNADGMSYTAQTNSSGAYSIVDIYPGTYQAELYADGYENAVITDIKIAGATVTFIPTTTLQVIGGTLSGSVSISGKADLSGISILAVNSDTKKSFFAITDSNGNFSWDSVSPGTYTVSASYPGYLTSSVTDIVVSMGSNISGVIIPEMKESTYSIVGKVILAGVESGFENTSVLLQDAATLKSVANTVTGIDGTYTISGIEAGTYLLTVTRDGYITSNSTVVTVGTVSVSAVDDIILKNAQGAISGTITLEGALDNAGISILVTSSDSEKTYSTTTDSSGHYALSGILPGTWRVQATKSGYTNGYTDPFTVSAGSTAEPNSIELAISLRSIFGSVVLEGRTDCAGVKITATNIQKTSEIYSALTNSSGFYALSSMTPGEYILSYSFEGYRTATSSSVSLSEESSIELEAVTLSKATGKISGIVNLEGCTDHSGILVSLVGTDYTYTTESDGAYEFTVPSGNYPGGVRFSRDDFQLTAKAETIPVLTDSTYGVLTVEMKCTANTLKGIVHLAGSDDASEITVTIDGLDSEEFSVQTDSEGNWQIDHVPLGYRTVRFTKTNVPDVTTEVNVIASDYIELSALEMIPDSATLKGNIYLDGMTDHSGIDVTVSTLDKDDITVRTTSDGAFIATNILASGSHTVTFSKKGWNSQSIIIDDFEPLEERVIGAGKEYVLSDTTAPAWSSNPVVINSGANYTDRTALHIELSPEEYGSGIAYKSVQIQRTVDGTTSNLYPSEYNWQPYVIGFDYDLADLPDMYVGNGTYELFITLKDKSGNISQTASKSITVTDLITSLSGVLTGDRLHLTEENSPYLVEADCLVSESDVMYIDPGVEVRFAGNYSITVSGSIEARGTAEKKILFTSDSVEQEITYTTTEYGEYINENGEYCWGEHEVTRTDVMTTYWNGIAINGGSLATSGSYNYASGNIMEYCEFEYANRPLTVKSGAYINHCSFHDNTDYVYIHGSDSSNNSVVMNSDFENGIEINANVYTVNNIIENFLYLNWSGCSRIQNNTIKNANIRLYAWNDNELKNNEFVSSSINCEYDYNFVISNNNFTDCTGTFVSTTREYESGRSFNLTGNYWGAAQTQELESKGTEANISFISDYYDNFNYARINYSGWLTEPVENAGYLGDGFIDFDVSVNGYSFTSKSGNYPETTDPNLSVEVTPLYYANEISSIRIAQNLSELKTMSWSSFSRSNAFTVDKEKLVNGFATLFVQIKDTMGNMSSPVQCQIPYDSPVITSTLTDGIEYTNPTGSTKDTFKATDGGNIAQFAVLVDGIVIDSNTCSGNSVSWDYNLGLQYMSSGTHTLTLKAWDSARNCSEKNIQFTITRSNSDISSLAGTSWSTSTGKPLKDDRTIYLWNLDNSGAEENDSNATINSYTSAIGGFGGCASYVSTNDIPLGVGSNAFTIEYWVKGSGGNPSISFYKGSSFDIYEYNYGYLYAERASGDVKSHQISLSHPPADSQWHYVAMVYNGSYFTTYIDGVLASYNEFSSLTLCVNDNKLNFNSNNTNAVDEIRISSAARSPDEIAAYYKDAKAALDKTNGKLDAIIY